MSRSTTAGSYGAVSVTTSATQIVAPNARTTGVTIQPIGGDIYVGPDSSVTTSNGIKITDGNSANYTDHLGAVYGIASGTVDVRYWRQG